MPDNTAKLMKIPPVEEEKEVRQFIHRLLSLGSPYRKALNSLADAYDKADEEAKVVIFNQLCWLAIDPNNTECAISISELPDGDTVGLERQRNFVGKRVARFRNNLGWTQKTLADAAGMKQSQISRVEAGKFDPTYKTIASLAKAMGIKCGDLDPSYDD